MDLHSDGVLLTFFQGKQLGISKIQYKEEKKSMGK